MIPTGIPMTRVMEIVDNVVDGLAHKFKFGPFDADDIKQQGRLIAWQAIKDTYDEARPLENFLRVHVRNRLINFKRDNFRRIEPPCLTCKYYDRDQPNGCGLYTDKLHCDKWAKFVERNDAKQNIMAPITVDELDTQGGQMLEEEAQAKELEEKIDRYLDVELRADYLRLRAGESIPKYRKDKVIEAVRKIIGEDEA